MDLNRLFTMLTRMFIRSATDAGLDYAARKGKPQGDMTPQEREQARNAKALAGKARKLARLGRRFMR